MNCAPWRTFRIFVFGSEVGQREEASEQVAGVSGFFENRARGGGGASEVAGWGYRCREDVCREEVGEQFTFFGSETPTSKEKHINLLK